jgi:hypothetical protein
MSQRTGVKTHRVWLGGRLMRARERRFKGEDFPLLRYSTSIPQPHLLTYSLTYLAFSHRTSEGA